MNEALAPRSMSDLIHQKKKLIRKRENHPELAQALNANLADLDNKIAARLNTADNRYCNNFVKIAKNELSPEVFARLEQIASTRTQQHRQQGN